MKLIDLLHWGIYLSGLAGWLGALALGGFASVRALYRRWQVWRDNVRNVERVLAESMAFCSERVPEQRKRGSP